MMPSLPPCLAISLQHVCGDCSKKEAYLVYNKDEVCNKCYEMSKQDSSSKISKNYPT